MTLFCISSKKETHWKNTEKTLKTLHFQKHNKNQRNINSCIPWAGPKDHPRRPKSPQGPPRALPRHSERTFCVFGSFWPLPEDPLGPPEDPLGTPRDAKRTPKEPPRTPQDYERTPKDPQGLSKNLPRPLRDPKEAQTSPVNR